MLGIEYQKTAPSTYVRHFVDGKIQREGTGLQFWYLAPISTIVAVPLTSTDVPFAFAETTADFQDVTLNGMLSYRIADPIRASELVDFSVDRRGRYLNEGEHPAELLEQRLINNVQVAAKSVTQVLGLQDVLSSTARIAREILSILRNLETVNLLGVEILDLTITAIRPSPELARALEAEARESLQRRADQAIYARRNAAVEEERRIKESELNTEIAVENKRRQIRETQMQADIAIEQQRTSLIDQRVENDRKDADSRAYALETTLRPLQNADWRTLMAVAAKGADPRFAISLAFQELAQNASKIGQLNVSPDLMETLLRTTDNREHSRDQRSEGRRS